MTKENALLMIKNNKCITGCMNCIGGDLCSNNDSITACRLFVRKILIKRFIYGEDLTGYITDEELDDKYEHFVKK